MRDCYPEHNHILSFIKTSTVPYPNIRMHRYGEVQPWKTKTGEDQVSYETGIIIPLRIGYCNVHCSVVAMFIVQ